MVKKEKKENKQENKADDVRAMTGQLLGSVNEAGLPSSLTYL